MTSTTYQLDVPRWLWSLYSRVLEETDYDRYNDRLVEAVAVDVQRFDEAGLIDIDQTTHNDIRRLLDRVDTDDDVPAHSDGLPLDDEAVRGHSSTSDPRGERP